MKTRILFCCLGMCLFFCGHVFAENVLNSDAKFDIHIAVVINKDDDIVGKFEYANDLLQVVTFLDRETGFFLNRIYLRCLTEKL